MTNLEWIQSLSVKNLAKFLCSCMECTEKCPAFRDCFYGQNGMVIWLKSQAMIDFPKITDKTAEALEKMDKTAHGEV